MAPNQTSTPYADSSTNLIYNLLFCDNVELYKSNTKQPFIYPFDVLYNEKSSIGDLQKIIDDENSDARLKVLAYNAQLGKGHVAESQELLAVIIEVGLDEGLDVLASFYDGTARYINHSGKILIWETTDETSDAITAELFHNSSAIVKQIGPWDQPRRPHPEAGMVRISFLVSDGLYFGEGPIDVLFEDPMASPALGSATELMAYITEKGQQ